MKIRLDYGCEGLEVELPRQIEVLQMPETPGLEQIAARLQASLENPLGTLPLRQLAQGRKSACVVISDITRPVPNAIILPPLLRMLEEAGIARQEIAILVGTGLHRPNEGQELVALVGEEIATRYHIVNHLARRRETLVYCGDTRSGAPIWVDRVYQEAEFKVATGLIEPHLMAGYSGGRKAICPGIMGVDTMRVLHGPELMGHPRAAEGIVEGNPFHQQALEVARQVGVDFILNVSMNARREITGIFSGELEQAHAEGVHWVEARNGALIERPAEIVVTTGAGYPLDLTFYQTIKGMTAALPVVSPGGTIIVAARCAEGLGSPDFQQLLLGTSSPQAFLRQLEDPHFFVVDQWQVQELCKVLTKAQVTLVSEGIGSEYRNQILVDQAASVEEAIELALKRYAQHCRIAVIPKGPYVLARVK